VSLLHTSPLLHRFPVFWRGLQDPPNELSDWQGWYAGFPSLEESVAGKRQALEGTLLLLSWGSVEGSTSGQVGLLTFDRTHTASVYEPPVCSAASR
jgi:hypothetical protein